VQSQLSRVLASAHFRNSKRSQAILRHVVEAVLAGNHGLLKERSIGAAVFGRESSYDTAQDPIVRNAAIEVRKRLAQYYLETEHASELRIELPIGSYQPAFRAELPLVAPHKSDATDAKPVRPATQRRHLVKPALALAMLVTIAVVAAFLWNARRTQVSELEAFWEPVFRDNKPVQISIGQPTRVYRFTGARTEELNRALGGPSSPDRDSAKLSIGPAEVAWVAPEYVFLRDALSSFKVASWIQSHGRAYQLMSVAQTNYSQLRHAPLVAIGAFNNSWGMRVTSQLRFEFDRRTIGGVSYNLIADRRNPDAVNWKVTQPVVGAISEDFAIVTRVFDSATERAVISAAGIEAYGTLAASEFVTQAEYLGAALQSGPKAWRKNNVQFVLRTKIIDGTPGPPGVLAAHYW
jgi:hypothetical protein